MKRRNFLKSLAALAVAPLATMAGASPAKPETIELSTLKTAPATGKRREGMYAWAEQGFAVLDNRSVKVAEAVTESSKKPCEGQLSELFISPEAMADIQNWGVDQIDEQTRKELYLTGFDDINDYSSHVSHLNVSTPLGREEIHELGRRGPWHRFVDFPVEVDTEVITIDKQSKNTFDQRQKEANARANNR